MLVSGTYDPSPVTVTGEACHESQPITSLSVNGTTVSVSGDQLCEDFSVTVDSPWGMTAITVIGSMLGIVLAGIAINTQLKK